MNHQGRILFGMLTTAVLALATACGDDPPPVVPDPDPPPAPTGVSANANGNDVTVTWSGQGDSYIVERQAAGASFTQIASGITATTYMDTGVAEGAYAYRVIAVANGLQSDPSDPALVTVVGEDLRAYLTGTISGTRTLDADSTYILRGIVTVDDGGELHIPAGTLLQGDVATQPTALIVRTGGKIFSEGTADAPVVFTSTSPPGERRAGDWGGVVINGKSLCNFPASECVGEGSSGTYGGSETNDDSGVMTYTRVEFAGFEVSFGNELNALTLNGVGAGTVIHHVQTNVGLDDGIEFFGGTVDLKYALVTNASDDSFDYSTGWQGRGQFWIAQQNPNDADNGFEVDGNEDDYNATPFTAPTIYNVTLVGNGPGGTGGEKSDIGLLLRRGTGGAVYNTVVIGFGDQALDVDNSETLSNGLELRNSVFADNMAPFATDDDGIDEEGWFMNEDWGNRVAADAMLMDPYNREAPDFTPASGSPLLTGAATPPNDGFFTVTDFIGAAAPGGEKWWMGWTSFAIN